MWIFAHKLHFSVWHRKCISTDSNMVATLGVVVLSASLSTFDLGVLNFQAKKHSPLDTSPHPTGPSSTSANFSNFQKRTPTHCTSEGHSPRIINRLPNFSHTTTVEIFTLGALYCLAWCNFFTLFFVVWWTVIGFICGKLFSFFFPRKVPALSCRTYYTTDSEFTTCLKIPEHP